MSGGTEPPAATATLQALRAFTFLQGHVFPRALPGASARASPTLQAHT